MSLHILLIEDDNAIAEMLTYACNEAGITVTHCLFGHQGLDKLATQAYDFIILDVGLPDATGFEICKKIRLQWQTPILFLTARNHEVDRIVGLEIGADDYVTKPFSPREVVARVHAILRRLQPTPSKAITSTVFQVDDAAKRISFYNTTLALTRYEFHLLKTLIENPTHVYSRQQLMDLVWENAEDTLERTVDAHIKTIRTKLRNINAEQNTIVTHRGMGYSLQ
jgi:two-component system, OmpR family, catabolic regulation response regulator CreB